MTRDEEGVITSQTWLDPGHATQLHGLAHAANRQAGQAIAVFSKLDGARTLLDLGGGDGTLAEAYLARYPKLRVTLVDLPPSAHLARHRLRRWGGRVTIETGDLFQVKLKQRYDACLVSRVMRFFRLERNRQLLWLAHEALRPGGRLILHDQFEGAAPRGAWQVWPVSEVQVWMHTVGFLEVQEVIPGQLLLAKKPTERLR